MCIRDRGKVRAAALQNLSGEFVTPNTESGAIALNGIKLDNNLAGKNPNPTAKGAYPIATLTWILAYEKGNGRNTKAIQDTFYKLLSDEYQDIGTPLELLIKDKPILENINKHEISTEFVLTQPDKLSGRGLTASKSLFINSAKLPVLQPDDLNSKDLVDKIKDFGVDILVVVAYGKLLPTWLLNTPKFGCLNVHFSKLPKYRGAAPIQRAIENGEKETGISFMKLTEGLDEGPIYKNIVVNIENKGYRLITN